MDDKKTVFMPQSDPLIGQKLGDLVKIIKKIGTGGMCDVYMGEIDIHMYRALKIIDGTLEPQKLGLNFPKGKIEDPGLIEMVKNEAKNLGEKFSEITKELGDIDTTKIVQEGLLSDTQEEFRAKGNLVAVKVLQQNYAKDLQDNTDAELKKKRRIRERFIKEGKTLKRLSHPNLIKSIETGYDEIGPEKMPVYFYVMEYVEVYSFLKHDEENPLPIEKILKIAKAILKACDYIHSQDPPIIHRDIKPSNVLVDEKTIDKEEIDSRLTDLGFAKIRDEDSSASPKDISQSQEFAGTPNYVAPEQAQGLGTATPASDMWSVAATLYELLTGHAPYEVAGNAAFAVLSKILECERPEAMRKYNNKIPQMLEDIILMNFTKKQEDRLCPAKEFIYALDYYTTISKKENIIENIKEKIKEQEKALKKSKDKKSEELAELYDELLYKTERKITESLPDQGIIRDRISFLDKIIEKTASTDANRINFLKKYRRYEETFLIKRNPSTEIEQQPKKKSKLGLAITAAAIILLGVTGWFITDTYKRHSEISKTHRNIKAELVSCKFNIGNNDLESARFNLQKIKAERSSLPKNFSSELDQKISSLEKEYTYKRNDAVYAESKASIRKAYEAFAERKFAQAKTDADLAENRIKQLILKNYEEYKTKKEEIEKEVAELRTKLAGKDEAIRTFDFVKESYERINNIYEEFKKDLENDKLFDKKEIDLLNKKVETHKNTLIGVEEDFQDESKNLLPEYTNLEEKMDILNEKISTLGKALAEKQYFADLNKKAGEGDKTAQQIMTLEKKIKEKPVYIQEGMTTEYLDDLKTEIQEYLSGKNVRSDTKISIIFDEIIQKLPQFKEKKEALEKQAGPLFSLSWKIERLGAELEQNPESKEIKEKYDTAVAEFSQKAQEQKKQFTDFEEEIRKYLMTGTEISNPQACLSLGRLYEAAGEKERAAKAYKKYIEAGKKYIEGGGCDLLTDEEEIREAEAKVTELEQN